MGRMLGQPPQLTTPPQPFAAVPQIWPDWQAWVGSSGVQPHTLAVPPPPQVSKPVHWVVPQST